jgi:hypothetical protein
LCSWLLWYIPVWGYVKNYFMFFPDWYNKIQE